MAYVTHNRTKSEEEALVGLQDTIYYTTDSNSIIINGKAYGAVAQKVTYEEFNNLLETSALTPGKTYRIIGFTTKVAPNDAVVSLEHKIDLYVTATSSNFVAAEAFAGYNSDGSDTYYEDNGVDVAQWQINVQVYGSKLGITKALTVQNTKITTLRVGDIRLIRHNGIDTLLVVYNKSKWIGRSTDGGQTFQHVELPLYSTDWKDLGYGDGKFILIDSDGHFLVSEDNGLTWTVYSDNLYMDVVSKLNLNITVNYGYRQCVYIDGHFYIVGQKVLLKSADGINWSAHLGVSHPWVCPNIAGGDGILIMPGGTGQGYIQLSFDGGETWESKFLENNFWYIAGFGNHTIAMLAGNCQSARIQNTDTITLLSDISWTGNYQTGNPVPRDSSQICFNNGVFYCTGSYHGAVSSYAYSTDGLNWNSVPFPKAMNPQGGGSALPTFGPNGELYIVDSVANSIWVNPTPMDGTTWRELPGTSIDIYDYTATNGQVTLVIPTSRANYYRSEDGERYYAYEFENGLRAGNLLYSNKKFYTILSNINKTESYIATSVDGIAWELSEFTEAPASECVAILENNDGIILIGFDNGQLFLFTDNQISEIVLPNIPVYSGLKITYDKRTDSFIYSGVATGTNASTTFVKLAFNSVLNSWTAEQFNLPGEMNVNGIVATNVISCGGNVYVSGKDPDKATTVRTFLINLTTNSAQRVELPSNITHSSSDGIRVLAKTEDQSMYILEGVNAYQFDGVKARAFWDKGNDTILCAYGEESLTLTTVKYTRQHNIQISKLTDEYNNTCLFDFKNIVRITPEGHRYFFDNGFQDYSYSGNVRNFKQTVGDDTISTKAGFIISNQFDDVSVVGDTNGIFTFPVGARHIVFSDTELDCDFSNVDYLVLNPNCKWITSDYNTLELTEFNKNVTFSTTDHGVTWNTDATGRLSEDIITNMVLNTTSLKDAYLEPFDANVAYQLTLISGYENEAN